MNIFYYPYKPNYLDQIRIILFLPNIKETNTIILSNENLDFEHHRLLQTFLKENKDFSKQIKLKINKYTLIYELSIIMAKYNIATFVNCSYVPFGDGYIVIPNSIKINQLENILNFAYLFDLFSFPIDTTIVDFNADPIPISIENNKDLYEYLNSLKKKKENVKVKRL